MSLLKNETFVCIDCETTGLDPENDQVIEVACVTFSLQENFADFGTLIDPKVEIPEDSIKIHHITQDMVVGKPTLDQVLGKVFELAGDKIIVGHGIQFDVDLLVYGAKRCRMPCTIGTNRQLDTLRLARYYGNSPTNSLEELCRHFNVGFDENHRAMSDVLMNIEVFKHLVKTFTTTKQLFDLLAKPIRLNKMPLGKHKGRPMKEVPLQYLYWAANKDFDQDLLYSIRSEINRRQKPDQFDRSSNPFTHL